MPLVLSSRGSMTAISSRKEYRGRFQTVKLYVANYINIIFTNSLSRRCRKAGAKQCGSH